MRTHDFRLGPGVAGLVLAAILAGCDYSAPPPLPGSITPGAGSPGASPGLSDPGAASAIPWGDKQAILENVVKLIQTAALKPGGDNFAIATKNLNQYFSETPPEKYTLAPEARTFLLERLPAGAVRNLESHEFLMPDARHIEDCMLYHGVASRVGESHGDDLTRVRRIFRWIMEQIELVPPGSLAAPGLFHAYARPYDVLLRGMATEADGFWAERAWVFMVLCRQIGVDVGLLTYTPEGAKEKVIWTCAALVDGKLYLFDTRVGLEVPAPGLGVDGVATLDQALEDPSVLSRLDLPGQSPYGTTRAALLGSKSKIGILIDSSPDYRSPRMALLQASLAGKNRTILYRDPADERDGFVKALGDHAGEVGFWELPAFVEEQLFHDRTGRFVAATIHTLVLFDPNNYPLVYARIKQLQGDLPGAILDYVNFRFVDKPMMVDKKREMPQEVQQALDAYATYFIGLCHLEQGNPSQAELFFRATLKMLPEYGRGQPYYNMFRWGAQANLARICEGRGDDALAIAYYTENDPTTQRHGNLYRARALVWRDPTAPAPAPLPPAPAATTGPGILAAPKAQ